MSNRTVHQSETSRCRERLAPYCVGSGLDVGFGGDPIKRDAICVDMPSPYTCVGLSPQHLSGTCANLKWFRDGVLDYVFSSHLIEDFSYTEQQAIVREFLRVIRPGGRVVLYQPDQQKFEEHCRKTGQPLNDAHKEKDYSLRTFLDNVFVPLQHEGLGIRALHWKEQVDWYSFEVVIEKL
jgi:predicted SAM-dependent methyltransferase